MQRKKFVLYGGGRVLKKKGEICWQEGNAILPLLAGKGYAKEMYITKRRIRQQTPKNPPLEALLP